MCYNVTTLSFPCYIREYGCNKIVTLVTKCNTFVTFDIKIILPETRISFKAENKEKLQKIADKFNQVLEKE